MEKTFCTALLPRERFVCSAELCLCARSSFICTFSSFFYCTLRAHISISFVLVFLSRVVAFFFFFLSSFSYFSSTVDAVCSVLSSSSSFVLFFVYLFLSGIFFRSFILSSCACVDRFGRKVFSSSSSLSFSQCYCLQ